MYKFKWDCTQHGIATSSQEATIWDMYKCSRLLKNWNCVACMCLQPVKYLGSLYILKFYWIWKTCSVTPNCHFSSLLPCYSFSGRKHREGVPAAPAMDALKLECHRGTLLLKMYSWLEFGWCLSFETCIYWLLFIVQEMLQGQILQYILSDLILRDNILPRNQSGLLFH